MAKTANRRKAAPIALPKSPTGIQGLDEVTGGGLPKGRPTLVCDGPGTGSEFVLRLPLVEPQLSAKNDVSASDKIPNGCKRRILLVDDSQDTVAMMATLLQGLGHEVSTAFDGLQALQAAAESPPDVVILDIGLPKMNGYEVARRLKQEPGGKGIKLIALTGWGQEDDKQRALDAGFDYHLVKPVKIDAIQSLLALIISRSQAG